MQQSRLLRIAFRVLSGCEAGQDSSPEDVRYLRSAAPELELQPDFVARYIIEREVRKRRSENSRVRVRANAAG
jgi:hypothetical protein